MPAKGRSSTKGGPNTVELDVQSKAQGEHLAANEEDGLFKCSKCKTSLYNSGDKLTGTTHKKPSFHKSRPSVLIYDEDFSYGLPRIVASCANCGQVVGHVYNKRTKQERHTVYSASITFSHDTTPTGDEDAEELESGDEEDEVSSEEEEFSDDDDDDEDEDEEEEDEDEGAGERQANFMGRIAIAVGAAAVIVGIKTLFK